MMKILNIIKKSCKDTLETGLGLLKVFNGYKEKNLLMIKFLLVLMISYMKELIHFHIL